MTFHWTLGLNWNFFCILGEKHEKSINTTSIYIQSTQIILGDMNNHSNKRLKITYISIAYISYQSTFYTKNFLAYLCFCEITKLNIMPSLVLNDVHSNWYCFIFKLPHYNLYIFSLPVFYSNCSLFFGSATHDH